MLPPIHGARLTRYLDGTTTTPVETLEVTGKDGKPSEHVPNPAYDAWLAQDQHVLGFLFSTLSKEVRVQVVLPTSGLVDFKKRSHGLT